MSQPCHVNTARCMVPYRTGDHPEVEKPDCRMTGWKVGDLRADPVAGLKRWLGLSCHPYPDVTE